MVVPLIVDTDLSIDTDDAGALCVAHALADLGEAKLLAVTHGTGLRDALSAIGAINHYYQRDDVPIGVYDGDVGKPEMTPDSNDIHWTNRGMGWYAHSLASEFPSPYRDNATLVSAAPSALSVLRRTLASAADSSVTIAAIGHATNLVALLESGPDGLSALSGHALVTQKVKQVVWMGGSFVDSGRIEWNFGACGSSHGVCGAYDTVGALTNRAVELWPQSVPLTFVSFDAGVNVHAGGALRDGTSGANPCRRAYDNFCGIVGGGGHLPEWCTPRGRAAWDLMAVLLAVRGPEAHYTLQPGFNRVDPSGSGQNTWWRGATHEGRVHYQAVLPDNEAARSRLGRELDDLLVRPPARKGGEGGEAGRTTAHGAGTKLSRGAESSGATPSPPRGGAPATVIGAVATRIWSNARR